MRTRQRHRLRVAVFGAILLAASGVGAAERPDAPRDGGGGRAAVLDWPDIAAALADAPAAARDTAAVAARLAGRRAALAMEYVHAQTTAEGEVRHLFRHVEGRFTFLCYVAGADAGRQPGWTGVFTGTLAGIAFAERDLRDNRVYVLRLDAAATAGAGER